MVILTHPTSPCLLVGEAGSRSRYKPWCYSGAMLNLLWCLQFVCVHLHYEVRKRLISNCTEYTRITVILQAICKAYIYVNPCVQYGDRPQNLKETILRALLNQSYQTVWMRKEVYAQQPLCLTVSLGLCMWNKTSWSSLVWEVTITMLMCLVFDLPCDQSL